MSFGIVGPVGVHLDDPLGSAVEGDAEAGEVRTAETRLGRAVEHADPVIGRGQSVRDLPGPVG